MITKTHSALRFPSRIGLGTWQLGQTETRRETEIGALTYALELGYRLIDTAEKYADGAAETVVGSALKVFGSSRRGELFIVSKVSAEHASETGTVRACEASLKRLGCDYLDLYLLHWPGDQPFAETLRGFGQLLRRQLIRQFGVSNFSIDHWCDWLDAQQSLDLPVTAQCNQIPYCAEFRNIEINLLPWQRKRDIQTMAYWPLGRDSTGNLARHPLLVQLGNERGVSAAQIALAWCLREKDIVIIPKSSNQQHLEKNLLAAELHLRPNELRAIDRAFPLRFRRLRQLKALAQLDSLTRRMVLLRSSQRESRRSA